jgi:hypothetical protein
LTSRGSFPTAQETPEEAYRSRAKWSSRNLASTLLATAATSVYAADLDGDGDLDVLSASANDDKIAWYENEGGSGSGLFSSTTHVITKEIDYAQSVYAADLDGDGDLDVLSASHSDNKIAWYENKGGSGSSWTPHEITTDAIWAKSVYAADLDGDLDVLSASAIDNKIAWYENDWK